MQSHRISVIVKNQPGILAQVSQLFGQSGINIDALSVGTYKEIQTSRMKISLKSEQNVLEKVITQLDGLMDVIQVKVAHPALSRNVISSKLSALFSKPVVAFWLVAYSLFITLLGTNIPSPLLALYRTQWHLTAGSVTLLFAIYALVVIPTIIISGQLSDQLGRKKLLIPGVFFTVFGSLLFAFSTNFTMLLLSRIFQGISVGMLNGVAVAALTELDPKQNRIKAAFVGSMAVTIGNALGPVLSGLLGEYAPFPMKLAYIVHMFLAIPGFIGLFYMREQIKRSGMIKLHRPAVPYTIMKRFYLSGMTSFIAWSIMSLMLSIIPSYADELVGSANLAVAGVIVALVLSVSTISQIVLKRLPLQQLSIVGFIVMIAGLVALVAVLETKSLIFLFLTTVLIGFGHGPAFAGSLALTNHISPNESRGDIIASFYLLTYLGVSLPILGLGFVAQWIGLTGAIILYTLLMTVMMLVGIVFWIADRRNAYKEEQ
ncbi:acetolactate synthase small subunit [Sporolactobacillus kofuensis]|uniref:acetolactate synthase n=1 Tax=Sporolactobacillus kofuensis TaxID=269672 RepID=A0ABW1WD82_9BACL|nr:acetolactate synthase small subunit [Sporolactobacillus kofuensis]MCO7175751.1 acetolactate synthase small subunit [Sporolactobacillus kofuensis]